MRDRARGWLVGGAIVAALAVAVAVMGRPPTETPLDPDSDRALGTSAFVALLERLGTDVDVTRSLPDDQTDTYVVLHDNLDRHDRAELREWVGEGGVAVVFDPGSPLVPPGSSSVDSEPDDPILGGRDDDRGPDPDDDGAGPFEDNPYVYGPLSAGHCDVAPLRDPSITAVEPYSGAVLYKVPERADSCFGDGDAANVVATPVGSGNLVAVGGAGIVVNAALGAADNAPVVIGLVAPLDGTRVAVLDPGRGVVSRGDDDGKSLLELIPTNVKWALAQLGVAFVLYALWRARRVGAPVSEGQPVAVAGSELVAAVGGLLDRSGSPQHAADVLRADFRREVCERFAVPPSTPIGVLARVVAERTGADAGLVEVALGSAAVTSDRELLELAQVIDSVRKDARRMEALDDVVHA